MATSPEQVRTALLAVTDAAQAEVRAVSQAAPTDPEAWRAEMFAAAPLILSEYAPAATELGIDWFEEIRDEASPSGLYTPTPRLAVTDADVSAVVARTTEAFRDVTLEIAQETERLIAEMTANLEADFQRLVAAGFRETVTGNADDDPDAEGWQRFAREGGCKFCVMLADRGAVYTEASVHFAAHTNCGCVVGPSYDPDAPKADVMQYAASRRTRSEADKARLREYLNRNYPDAPG